VKKLSVSIPAYVRLSMKHHIVHKFEENGVSSVSVQFSYVRIDSLGG
jgi:hypothetical protein